MTLIKISSQFWYKQTTGNIVPSSWTAPNSIYCHFQMQFLIDMVLTTQPRLTMGDKWMPKSSLRHNIRCRATILPNASWIRLVGGCYIYTFTVKRICGRYHWNVIASHLRPPGCHVLVSSFLAFRCDVYSGGTSILVVFQRDWWRRKPPSFRKLGRVLQLSEALCISFVAQFSKFWESASYCDDSEGGFQTASGYRNSSIAPLPEGITWGCTGRIEGQLNLQVSLEHLLRGNSHANG